jgi:hypothetical protein
MLNTLIDDPGNLTPRCQMEVFAAINNNAKNGVGT